VLLRCPGELEERDRKRGRRTATLFDCGENEGGRDLTGGMGNERQKKLSHSFFLNVGDVEAE